MPDGVIGNTSDSESEESRFEPWSGNLTKTPYPFWNGIFTRLNYDMMKKISIILISCFIANISLFAEDSESDSLVYYHELTFSSQFEEEAFTHFFELGNKDYIALFLSVNSDIDFEEFKRINKSVQTQILIYNSPHYQKFKETKKIKKIYNSVHENYFKKYVPNTYFTDFFSTGEYNCVTATALYGIIFDKLKIPFTIKESFSHVFLIAYPNSNSVLVETTNPLKGYFVFNSQFKSNYVDYLKRSKLVSDEEYKNESTDELFDEFFYKEKDVNLKELAGLLYYNKGFELLGEKKYKDAFHQFEKSYFLYPSDKIGYFLSLSAAAILDECDYSDIKYVDYIYKIVRYKNFGINNDDIIGSFRQITHEILVSQSNNQLYDQFYKKISENIEDEELVKEISFIYNYEKGRICYNQFKYNDALKYTEKAFDIKPNHADAQSLFVMSVISNYSDLNDPQETIEILNLYSDKHPGLMDNFRFAQLKYSSILILCYQYFCLNDIDKAFEYLDIFEKAYPKRDENFVVIEQFIVNAYSSASAFYFVKGNYSEARKYLNKGLEYVPNNFELKNRLRVLK